MNALAFNVVRKSGGYIKATVLPAYQSEVPHFDLLDTAIVAFFLLSAGGLVALLALN